MRAWSRNVRYFLLLPSARAAPGNLQGQRKGPVLLPCIPLLLGSAGVTSKSQPKLQGWKRDCVLPVRYRSDAVSSNGKGNGEKACKNCKGFYLKIRLIDTFLQCGSWEGSCLRGGQAVFKMKVFPGPSAQRACRSGMGRVLQRHQKRGGPRTLLSYPLGLVEHPLWVVQQGWRGISP